MHRTTALLLWTALWIQLAGAVYFCGLLTGAPFVWAVFVSFVLGVALALWMFKLVSADVASRLERSTVLLLFAGLTLLTVACAFLSRRYGDWDAALIWNLHARHLAAGSGWRAMYETGASGNAAYPLGLPSTIAWIWRALGTQSQTVPFFVALLPTMAIPAVIFLEAARTRLWIGTVVLALFGLHRYYIALGLDQYADIQVAWLGLLTAVCMNRAESSGKKGYWVAAGLLLGALCWTKWDGVLLAACLLVAHSKCLFRQPRALLFLLLGVAPFLLTIFLFLQTGPPRAPLLTDLAGITSRAADGKRYWMIGAAFAGEAIGRHWPFAILIFATPFLWRKRTASPARRLYAAVVATILGYAAVYLLLVSTDLDWNLQFSLSRLLLQVYPLAVFAATIAVSSREIRRT